MTKTIRRELKLRQSPEAVWRALTDSAALAEWMYPNDFQPHVGHQFTFRVPSHWDKFDGVVHCEVLECVPPRELAFTWVGGEVNTRVSYLLEAEGTGTRVLFEHSGFEEGLAFKGAGYGWPLMHGKLAKVLDALASR